MNLLRLTKITALSVLTFGVFACSDDDDGGDVIVPDNSIADFVEDNADYSSLDAALDRTGLDETLDGTADFTVFAPNNAAFNTFLQDNGYESLNDVPVDLLTKVLMNHVQSGVIDSGDLTTGYIQSMAEAGSSGEAVSMYIDTSDGVMINGMSKVTTADIDVDNGVIHAVDKVIGLPNVVTFAKADPTFSNLVAALTREESFNFVETLMMNEDPAPFTVFALTNDAFGNLLAELEFAELGDVPTETLESILQYHVVTGANVVAEDLTDGMSVNTLEGSDFTVNLGDDVTITDSNGRTSTVIATDVQATNGVIHAIDTVLVPLNDGNSDGNDSDN